MRGRWASVRLLTLLFVVIAASADGGVESRYEYGQPISDNSQPQLTRVPPPAPTGPTSSTPQGQSTVFLFKWNHTLLHAKQMFMTIVFV